MDNQFKILLKAVLDASGIGESDISKVQKVVDKYTVNLSTDLDKAKLIKTIKTIVPELEAELKKITGVDIKINDALLSKAVAQVNKDIARAEATLDRFQSKQKQAVANYSNTLDQLSSSALDKNASRPITSDDSIKKLEAKIVDVKTAMDGLKNATAATFDDANIKVKEEISLLRNLVQELKNADNAANKELEHEYTQRQKLIQSIDMQAVKCRELVNSGKIDLDFTKTENQFKKLSNVSDELQTDFKQLQNLFKAINAGADNQTLVSLYEKFVFQLKKVNNELAQTKLTAEKAKAPLNDLDKQIFHNQLQAWKRLYSGATDFHGKIDDIDKKLSGINTEDELANLRKEFKVLDAEASALGVKGKNLSDTLSTGMRKFAEWTVGTSAIMQAVQLFKQASTELKGVNSILTEISKTSDRTAEQLKKLGDTSFEAASKYGNKANNYLLGVQEMSRAGYENSEQMAELSTLAQSAGDMTAELANDYLIASDAAYGYSGNIEKLTALLDGQNQINKIVPLFGNI